MGITGSALRGGGNSVDKVTLGGVEVWKLVTETDTEVTVVVPRADAAADTNVVLTADTGAVVTALSAWTYLAEGEITSVGPESGQVGTRVTIEGTSLFGGGDALESVTLAGVDVKIISANDSIAIVVIEDPSTGTGSVVLTSNTGAIVSVDDAFTLVDVGKVTVVSPGRGQYGTVVAIHGDNLFGGGSKLKSITFDGKVPLELVESSNTYIKVRIDASDPGVGNIVIISNTFAEVVLENGWTYDVQSDITEVCV